MKSKTFLGVSLGLFLVLILSLVLGCSSPAPAPTTAPAPSSTSAPSATSKPADTSSGQTFKLSYADFFPPVAANHIIQEEMTKEITKRTNGKVTFTHHPGGALLSATEMYNGVVNGLADIGSTHTGYTRGVFPFTAIAEQPLGYPSAWVATKSGWDFWNKYKTTGLMKEWDKVHVLIWHLDGAGVIDFLDRAKEDGRIVNAGFSFHGLGSRSRRGKAHA